MPKRIQEPMCEEGHVYFFERAIDTLQSRRNDLLREGRIGEGIE
jgi:hypothetical protein